MVNEKTIKEMTVEERVNLFLHVMKDDLNVSLVSVDFLDWLLEKGFFTAPASANHHLNYEGGGAGSLPPGSKREIPRTVHRAESREEQTV